MIRFDRSARSVVAVCTSCGAREVFLAGDGAAADSWALAHLARAHDPATSAAALTAARQRRHYRQNHQ